MPRTVVARDVSICGATTSDVHPQNTNAAFTGRNDSSICGGSVVNDEQLENKQTAEITREASS
jgi:hypothetical protein